MSVGVPLVDDQHKSLIEITNDLINTFNEFPKDSTLETILLGLLDYTIYHFDGEELYAAEYGAEDLEAHQKEHKEFIDKVSRFQNEIRLKHIEISLDLLDFLKDWLVTHINGSDKKLFSMLPGG